ncbi:MAG TPA: ABC transporter permease, partial [Terriglobales bacterium]|nr:ABC transporter permease [Terriglobales bacterium]
MKLWNEFIYSLRMLRKTPGVSLLVVFTLALGMGATTAVFSVIYAVLLKPLPYPDSGHIVALYEIKTAHDEASQSDVAPGNFLDWREQNRSFSAIAGFAGFHYILTGDGAPQHLWGGAVSAGWWKVFGVRPEIGRVFTAEEDRPNAPQVAVLTDRLWRTSFRADPRIVGRPIRLNGEAYTILGVMPPDPTTLHTEIDFWTPLQRQILPQRMLWRDSRFLRTFARLRPGISLQQAADDLNRISATIQREHRDADVYGGAMARPLRQMLTGDVRGQLFVAFAVVALLLLVACTNVANLMLVRVSNRARELAIRTALGARPRH